jgi:hypothetical protein
MQPCGVERRTGKLAPSAVFCADDPPGVDDARGADQPSDDHQGLETPMPTRNVSSEDCAAS